MMTVFSHPGRSSSGHDQADGLRAAIGRDGSLARRRFMRTLRKALLSCCVGVAVASALLCIMATAGTTPVVVAAKAISRGERITPADVRVAELPSSDAMHAAIRSADDATGGVAQVDIGKGQPLFRPMIRRRGVVPRGYTAIVIQLSSATDTLVPGDAIAVASALPCTASSAGARQDGGTSGNMPGNMSDGTVQADAARADAMRADPSSHSPPTESAEDAAHGGAGNEASCVVAPKALIIDIPTGRNADHSATVAMPPDDALMAIRLQEAGGGLVAVAR